NLYFFPWKSIYRTQISSHWRLLFLPQITWDDYLALLYTCCRRNMSGNGRLLVLPVGRKTGCFWSANSSTCSWTPSVIVKLCVTLLCIVVSTTFYRQLIAVIISWIIYESLILDRFGSRPSIPIFAAGPSGSISCTTAP